MRKQERKNAVYVGFMYLKKAYDKVNRESLWQVLRMYDVVGKPLNGIKSVYVNSLICVRVNGCESEGFMINSGVRQMCIMSPWLFNVYIDAVMKELKMVIEISRGGKRVEVTWVLVCR